METLRRTRAESFVACGVELSAIGADDRSRLSAAEQVALMQRARRVADQVVSFTALHNLALLCPHHHTLVEPNRWQPGEVGWRIHIDRHTGNQSSGPRKEPAIACKRATASAP